MTTSLGVNLETFFGVIRQWRCCLRVSHKTTEITFLPSHFWMIPTPLKLWTLPLTLEPASSSLCSDPHTKYILNLIRFPSYDRPIAISFPRFSRHDNQLRLQTFPDIGLADTEPWNAEATEHSRWQHWHNCDCHRQAEGEKKTFRLSFHS